METPQTYWSVSEDDQCVVRTEEYSTGFKQITSISFMDLSNFLYDMGEHYNVIIKDNQ